MDANEQKLTAAKIRKYMDGEVRFDLDELDDLCHLALKGLAAEEREPMSRANRIATETTLKNWRELTASPPAGQAERQRATVNALGGTDASGGAKWCRIRKTICNGMTGCATCGKCDTAWAAVWDGERWRETLHQDESHPRPAAARGEPVAWACADCGSMEGFTNITYHDSDQDVRCNECGSVKTGEAKEALRDLAQRVDTLQGQLAAPAQEQSQAGAELERAAKVCDGLWNSGITTPLGQKRDAGADDCASAIRSLLPHKFVQSRDGSDICARCQILEANHSAPPSRVEPVAWRSKARDGWAKWIYYDTPPYYPEDKAAWEPLYLAADPR